ncbi:hypothetical protein [Nocardiopsis ganjiahuensis]|uniref:hypothetical protein n=1 Tax=Nocardiopsis ganjiahuensis TaxID=239984 RepID=UPI000348650B|nr:hypothetical protein [Nocardiopsis ganjiahuensis]
MSDHLTPEQRARIDATVARVNSERADAGIMGAKYDDACQLIVEHHAEIVRLRRRAEALEDQVAAGERRLREELEARDAERDEEIDRRDSEIGRLRLALKSARARARQQRDALREALAADRDQVRRVRDRYRDERDTARRENADLRAQLAATTNPVRAEEQLAADTRPEPVGGVDG